MVTFYVKSSTLPSVQVQTDDRRPRSAGGVMTTRGQAGSVLQLTQSNRSKKPVDEQFERTTKLVLDYLITQGRGVISL